MKLKPCLSITQGLLFTYCIENSHSPEREKLIASKNVNRESDLKELFEKLTKPEFMKYKHDERQWHIDTLQHFLAAGDSFDSVFHLFDTYFKDEILDQREFMKILLSCLLTYDAEATINEST
ncbi:hypothetical protein HX780_06880 [Pseudomonas tolaasii]|uniref:hypothetical protein n=1 Tax=Pseudomonas tolaasii TaxID=29442 RepID=UPI0015A0BE24|nr:hypothetical protein [Pseudomonas tolaasii]NVZ48358.1 hypothetical protein [Pseudomonas tolaasii]NWA48015.1 hypothetical protein [Pseudomonas tolaasii]